MLTAVIPNLQFTGATAPAEPFMYPASYKESHENNLQYETFYQTYDDVIKHYFILIKL